MFSLQRILSKPEKHHCYTRVMCGSNDFTTSSSFVRLSGAALIIFSMTGAAKCPSSKAAYRQHKQQALAMTFGLV